MHHICPCLQCKMWCSDEIISFWHPNRHTHKAKPIDPRHVGCNYIQEDTFFMRHSIEKLRHAPLYLRLLQQRSNGLTRSSRSNSSTATIELHILYLISSLTLLEAKKWQDKTKHLEQRKTNIQQEAFEKCWAHFPQRAASRPFTRCC